MIIWPVNACQMVEAEGLTSWNFCCRPENIGQQFCHRQGGCHEWLQAEVRWLLRALKYTAWWIAIGDHLYLNTFIIHMATQQIIANCRSSSAGGVLFCTDVCGMGVHVLAVGVSLGDYFVQGLSSPTFKFFPNYPNIRSIIWAKFSKARQLRDDFSLKYL